MRARVVRAAADFGLLLSNFRPGSIIAWLSANTSSEQTWTTTPRIYCSSRRPIDWKHIGRRFADRENGLLCIQPYYDVVAGVSIKAPPPKWMTDTNGCEHDLVLLWYIIGTISLYMGVLDVYTCVQGDALTRDIVFLNFKYLCIKCVLRLLYHML